MEQLNRISSYFNERDRRRLMAKQKESDSGFPEMSEEEVRLSCLENNGYETAELNDKLYLHFRGFKKIENLDKYTGCKSIWLDSNGFDKIENLSCLTELRCLYLSKNLISKIEGLNSLQQLTILDLSNNRITHLENLSCCASLQTLNISHNALASGEAIAHLQECTALTTLDVTNNRLPADDSLYALFQAVPKLVTLSLNGNEITKLPAFRKKMIGTIGRLGYLDRPVEERERLCAEAFLLGGVEAEEQARVAWKEQQDAKRVREMEEYKEWQREQQKLRERAREEGRALISEFTPQEQEQRRAEAVAAAEAERRMLGHGVDKLASRFWKLEERGQGGDLLEQAAEELEREEEQKRQQESRADDGEDYVKHHTEETAGEERGQVEEVGGAEKEEGEEGEREPAAESEDILEAEESPFNAQKEEDKEGVVEQKGEEEEEEELRREEEKKKEREEEKKREREEALQRQQRVQDSMDIYLRQLKAKGEATAKPPSSTWGRDSPPREERKRTEEAAGDRPLYWSEAMDMQLAKLVVSYAFDFESIAEVMQQSAEKGGLGSLSLQPSLLTPQACKERWGALDASQWSTPAPGVTAQDTVFRVNFSDDYLQGGEQGRWTQPSFDALRAMSSARMPTYLKVPTAFPSVQDFEELD